MLSTFCLRLACGLAASLLLLPVEQINQRFFRAHFLTILGLVALAAMAHGSAAGLWSWLLLAVALACAFVGSFVWSLRGAPGGKTVIALTAICLVAALAVVPLRPANIAESEETAAAPYAMLLADDLTSAAVLGSATTAMLMGHSYLITPTMSLTPLRRLLAALLASLTLRALLAGLGLWSWTAGHSLANLEDETVLWLPLRWGFGLLAPLVLGWMAWQTTKIRSTQSATGILYVVVIFSFLGELTSQVLLRNSGFIL
jgi:hypothetical protein